ncbi:MAG: formate/nitrite transporter family protein [Fusicatenibacter saccharivorans]
MTYKNFSEAAVNKARLLKEHPRKYFLRAVMAGFFIVVAMIFSNVVGNTFQSTRSCLGKLLGGIVFAIAVLLIVFIGAELFTGNNLVMAFGAYDKKVSWAQVGKVWLSKLHRKLCRMPDSSVIFVLAGASGTAIITQDLLEINFPFLPEKCFPCHSLQLLRLPRRCLRHEM